MQIVMTDEEIIQAMLDGGRAGAAEELRKRLIEVKNAQAMADTAHAELTQALGEAHLEARVWKKSAEGRLGPSRTSR